MCACVVFFSVNIIDNCYGGVYVIQSENIWKSGLKSLLIVMKNIIERVKLLYEAQTYI